MLASVAAADPSVSGAAIIGILLLIMLGMIFVVFVLVALTLLGLWKVFVKAGKPGWGALIPVYNRVALLEMVHMPLWWIVLFMIPVVNIVLYVLLAHRLAVVFGRGWGYAVGLIFLPFIFYPVLGLGDAEYKNTYPPARPMSEAVKWSLFGALAMGLSMVLFFMLGSVGANSISGIRPLSIIDSTYGNYATDGVYVYNNDKVIGGADPQDFEVAGLYALSGDNVYAYGESIFEADRDTFHAFGDSRYAADAHAVYRDGQVMEGADPATFVPLDSFYSQDAHAVYFEDRAIAADPKTFQVVNDATNYDAKDAHNYYYDGEMVAK